MVDRYYTEGYELLTEDDHLFNSLSTEDFQTIQDETIYVETEGDLPELSAYSAFLSEPGTEESGVITEGVATEGSPPPSEEYETESPATEGYETEGTVPSTEDYNTEGGAPTTEGTDTAGPTDTFYATELRVSAVASQVEEADMTRAFDSSVTKSTASYTPDNAAANFAVVFEAPVQEGMRFYFNIESSADSELQLAADPALFDVVKLSDTTFMMTALKDIVQSVNPHVLQVLVPGDFTIEDASEQIALELTKVTLEDGTPVTINPLGTGVESAHVEVIDNDAFTFDSLELESMVSTVQEGAEGEIVSAGFSVDLPDEAMNRDIWLTFEHNDISSFVEGFYAEIDGRVVDVELTKESLKVLVPAGSIGDVHLYAQVHGNADDGADQQIRLQLISAHDEFGQSVGLDSYATVTVLDDDEPAPVFAPTVVGISSSTVLENAGEAVFTVALSEAVPDDHAGYKLFVKLDHLTTSAADFDDLQSLLNKDGLLELVVEPGQQSASFALPIHNDHIVESDEVFALQFFDENNQSLSETDFRVSIIDNDISVKFSGDAPELHESHLTSNRNDADNWLDAQYEVTGLREGESFEMSYHAVGGYGYESDGAYGRTIQVDYANGETVRTLDDAAIAKNNYDNKTLTDRQDMEMTLVQTDGEVVSSRDLEIHFVDENDVLTTYDYTSSYAYNIDGAHNAAVQNVVIHDYDLNPYRMSFEYWLADDPNVKLVDGRWTVSEEIGALKLIVSDPEFDAEYALSPEHVVYQGEFRLNFTLNDSSTDLSDFDYSDYVQHDATSTRDNDAVLWRQEDFSSAQNQTWRLVDQGEDGDYKFQKLSEFIDNPDAIGKDTSIDELTTLLIPIRDDLVDEDIETFTIDVKSYMRDPVTNSQDLFQIEIDVVDADEFVLLSDDRDALEYDDILLFDEDSIEDILPPPPEIFYQPPMAMPQDELWTMPTLAESEYTTPDDDISDIVTPFL